MTDYEQYLSDLNIFFKLKQKYEEKWNTRKRKLLRHLKNKRDGKSILDNVEKKCIQCKRSGGTLFEIKNNICSAKCNANENKCSLNIEIKYANYMTFDKLKVMTNKNLEMIKNKIIINKLNLLFDLENEDVVLAEFENFKEELKNETLLLKLINEHKQDLDTIVLQTPKESVMTQLKDDTKEEMGETGGEAKDENNDGINQEKRILKTDRIRDLNIKLDDNIRQFKLFLH